MGGAYHQRGAKVVDEQVKEGHQHIEDEKAFGEGAQAILLTEFYQQQVDRDVRHHVDRRKPGYLGGPGGKGSLQQLQVSGDHRVAQRTGQADQQPNDPVGNAPGRAVNRGGRRAEDRRFFVRSPVVGHIGVIFTARHYFFSTSRSSFSSTR